MLKSLMVSENSLAFFLVLDLPLSRFSSLYKFSWNFSEIGYIIRLSKYRAEKKGFEPLRRY